MAFPKAIQPAAALSINHVGAKADNTQSQILTVSTSVFIY